MPEGDPIDEFYVRLSADTSQFLEGINEAIKRAMEMTEKAVVEIGRTWEQIGVLQRSKVLNLDLVSLRVCLN